MEIFYILNKSNVTCQPDFKLKETIVTIYKPVICYFIYKYSNTRPVGYQYLQLYVFTCTSSLHLFKSFNHIIDMTI